ncbi:MAG: hypothetical protein FJW61_06580, partial [Actinobacteria bacterium]|nr:hypothetical protein [Actinomycetota bacterium]
MRYKVEEVKSKPFTIDAENLNYRDLNFKIKQAINSVHNNSKVIVLKNVVGQRYIGDGIKEKIKIKIYGTPGNDMAAFMDGPEIEVFGNGQDGIGNTMNSGRIILHGDCGDILGYSMRGGEIYVRGSVGWRSGIHMKSYLEKFPVIVIGGRAGNFLGEYIAGGVIIVLGLNLAESNPKNIVGGRKSKSFCFNSGNFFFSFCNSIIGDYTGTGMHGGVIYLKKDVEDYRLGREVKKMTIDENDIKF